MKQALAIFCFVLLTGSITAHSVELKPPWLQTEVIQRALEIGMTDEQSPLFKQAISNFFDNLNSAVHKLIRRNVTSLPREVRRKRNLYAKRMDAEIAEFITSEQLPRYYVYRDLLLARMSDKPPSVSPANLKGPTSHNQ